MLIGVIVLLMFIVPAVISVRKSEEGKRPYIISWVILGLLVLNGLLFLTDSYSLLPADIADVVFVPVWLILCAAGIISVVYEFKKNKGFAVSMGGLISISLLFIFLVSGISKM